MSNPASIHLNQNISSLRPSATLLINERSAELEAQGREIYRLGFGQSPFPVPHEVTESLRQYAHIKDYLPVKGLPLLREAVAHFNKKTLGLECTSDDVLIGPGSKELIYQLQLALDADLLLPSPSWVSYEPQAQLAHKKVYWLDTKCEQDWLLQPETLDAFCKKNNTRSKILILNYPNNPVGNTYTSQQLKSLSDVAKKYKILVVADEIYAVTHHEGQHESIAKYYPEGTIISSGLSKWAGAGGWRLGTFTFPKNYRYILESMAVIASETFTSVSAPIQYAAVTAYSGSEYITKYVNASREILKKAAHLFYTELTDLNLVMPPAAGGFYLFPNFENHKSLLNKKGIEDSVMLCEKLLAEASVALLPGVAFGRPAQEFTARLSYVDFDGEKAINALLLEKTNTASPDFVDEYFPKLKTAIDSLKYWLSA